jgi:hypothetical protein
MTLNIPPPPSQHLRKPKMNPISTHFRGLSAAVVLAVAFSSSPLCCLSCVAMHPTLRALAAAAARGASGGWGWGVSVDIVFCGVMMGTSAERCERIVGKLFAFFVGVVVGISQALVECLYSSR